MIYTISAILLRILSNSYLNVFQKLLTNRGQKSSVVNFYTYLGLGIFSLLIMSLNGVVISSELLKLAFIMGALGALGNYFIIKALSIGELSTLAPINSYKPIVALFVGLLYLHETPSIMAVFGILLVIAGTYFVMDKNDGALQNRAIFYRVLALIFSGTEAIFIKKIILMSDVTTAFVYWTIAGLVFAGLFVIPAHKSLKVVSLRYQVLLVLAVGLMQYATNFVFARMNVSYALALFQLSTLISVVLGVRLFDEKQLKRKLVAAFAMVLGAIVIILV